MNRIFVLQVVARHGLCYDLTISSASFMRKDSNDMVAKEISQYISLILRHKPEIIGITLDEHGWANVTELIGGVNKTYPLNMEALEEIVSTDEKKRYSFNDDKTLIRANQGHSIQVDVELQEVVPPKYLYHGTGKKYVNSIDKHGLLPKSRLYVHLCEDIDTAIKVGSRHGQPIVYRVLAGLMFNAGMSFYKSANGVWLAKRVPTEYFRKEECMSTGTAEIVRELKTAFKSGLDAEEVAATVLSRYSWNELQPALIAILLDDSLPRNYYEMTAGIFWEAVLDGQQIQKEIVVGLLYYRLGDKKAPYDNNLIWSIATELYSLDYADSEFNPFYDAGILKVLGDYGITFS